MHGALLSLEAQLARLLLPTAPCPYSNQPPLIFASQAKKINARRSFGSQAAIITTAKRRIYASPGGCNSAALPIGGLARVRWAGPFIMCVRPRTPDVGDVAGQDEKAHNMCGNGLSDSVVVRGQYIHLRSASNGIERQPNSVGYKQHNSPGSHDLPLNSAAGACDAPTPFFIFAAASRDTH